ncbi:hypothetical protein TRVL_02641 [Trypanosoma vivax]|nr:hypothetical protein TRVL_02641 [Trypanosoma vivax]
MFLSVLSKGGDFTVDDAQRNVVTGEIELSRTKPRKYTDSASTQPGRARDWNLPGRASMQYHRLSWTDENARLIPCTCVQAASDTRLIVVLVSGSVDRNPGPLTTGAEWNSCGPSQV